MTAVRRGARSPRAFALAVLLSLASSMCGQKDGVSRTEHVSGGTFVAKIGDVTISRELVRDAARARGVDPAVVLSELVDDAVLARAAERRGFEAAPSVRRDLRAVLGRVVAERLRDEERRGGPPTDGEVREMSELRWREVEVPEGARVIHAIVIRPGDKEPDRERKMAAMHPVAEALLAAVRPATSADDFEARAKSVAAPNGLEVRVERLPIFVANGFVAEPGSNARMDETFTKAAFALREGEQSGLVETPFGLHVIRRIERTKERSMPLEERRALFADEVKLLRTRAAYERILAAQSKGLDVEVRADAEDAMRRAHEATKSAE